MYILAVLSLRVILELVCRCSVPQELNQ